MVDFAMDVFRQLYDDKEVPKELKDKRVSVVAELKSLQSAVVPITTILEDSHVTEQIQNSRDGRQLFETLQKDHKFKPEYLDVLYNFAKFQYECGNYSGAAEYLYFHRVLAPKLNMSEEEAEKWVVNMIRNARLDAKIDSEKGHVVMGTLGTSPYQQVIEKTKNQAVRAQMLAFNVEKKLGLKGENTSGAAVPWNQNKDFD